MNRDERCAIWLYGSLARGDADRSSDVDVLLACNDSISDSEIRDLSGLGHEFLSISQYSWPEIKGMARYGSLFLHHLRAEGKPVFESRSCAGELSCVLNNLGPYLYARRDLEAFKATLCDVRQSIENGGTPVFELSVLGTVFRHSAILACYVLGSPCFGRSLPVSQAVQAWGLPEEFASEFDSLYSFRLSRERKSGCASHVGLDEVLLWCERLARFLSELEVRIHAHD
jgi:hypothetical protein